MSRNKMNIKMQLNKRVDGLLRIGQTKVKETKGSPHFNPNRSEGIHSIKTAETYRRVIDRFGDYCKSQGIKTMSEDYATANHFPNPQFYVDDGWTGTNFDRPGFQRMKADMESGKIGIVIIKDLSRLGRDYIRVGEFVELIAPSLNVRYIAIGDHIDTNQESNELLGLKSFFNDWYARDTSRKVRASYELKKTTANASARLSHTAI